MIVGDMARDDALAGSLDAEINVIGRHANPGLTDKAEDSGGIYYQTPGLTNTEVIAAFAEDVGATLAVVTFDTSLAAGTVDALRRARPDMKIVGPPRGYAELEATKLGARRKVDKVDSSFNPLYLPAANPSQVDEAIEHFTSLGLPVAIKPDGPAGGRGSLVMGKNLRDYEEARQYAKSVLNRSDQTTVLIEEALEGIEFNLQIMTDGRTLIAPPITKDYPYRDKGNTGPPTGGMGSVSYRPDEIPPFLTIEDYENAMTFSKNLLRHASSRYAVEVGDFQHYSGWLYPNFIKTAQGVKLIEENVRPGDPEWMNIQTIMHPTVDMVDVLSRMATGELRQADVRFLDLASTVIYFVPEGYARDTDASAVEFDLDWDALAEHSEVNVFFSSAVKYAGRYKTVGTSRPVAFAASAETPAMARQLILDAHFNGGPAELEFLDEVGKQEYLDSLQDPRQA